MEKFQRRLIALLLAVFTLTAATAFADDNNDFGMKYSAEASKKINKHWSVDAGVGFRTRNNAKTADQWDVSVGAGYKITHWLKADAGYQFIYDNNEEDWCTTTFKLNFAVLGKKLGKNIKVVKEGLDALTGHDLKVINEQGKITVCLSCES